MSLLGTPDFLFYAFAAICLISGIVVVMAQNPIYSALSLAFTMISIAGLFVTLDAYFIAGVQLIVYAGAVMVLFVMVLMLFDLKHEMKSFSKGLLSNGLKLASAGVLLGLLLVYINYTFATEPSFKPSPSDPQAAMLSTKALATSLFSTYLFAFEAIGVLLLVIAVGAVTLSRISGGTHAND
ncbi:MAG: NADH-quinone oxidoreductase subunit J [Bdellovibrionota bacterium]